ncbi:Pentatricopeptide repeat-containing protein [Camellia lanceoleosa]|uniref:Pentatricopeptide repeat-containing protein n=1 Tax=Camellia lanceoleosa TaxID=1840588 RepID=A0ACC0GZ01_9ERIC|nr:Pentatricopeptide repeat-containing protein [Camellia lanceoleosa]
MAFHLEPISPTPLPPRLPSHDSKPISLPFQSVKQKQLISHSQTTNCQTHLSSLDGPVNSTTYASILEACNHPILGKQVHAHALKMGFHGHEFVETKLLQMYGRCGCFQDATHVFDEMPMRNLYSWVAILNLYVGHGFFEKALLVFQELLFGDIGLELQFFVFPVVLKICIGLGGVGLGRQLHGFLIKNGFVCNIYVGNALIDMYGKCGSLDAAKKVLEMMPEKDCVSWNSLATACATNGVVYEALEVLEKMLDKSTPNIVSWSAVIGGFSKNGYDDEAIEMLYKMQAAGFEPNAQTLASVLPACARLEKLSLGKEIHGYITRHGFMSNPIVVNGLLDVYRRCADMGSSFKIFSKFSVKNGVSFNTMIVGYCENGEISKAEELFNRMELEGIRKDIISWNSMISGYVDNLMFNEALSLYKELLMTEGIQADSFTLGSVLTACTEIGSLRLGKEVHSHAIVRGLHSNPFVGRELIEMYCKCKDVKAAQMTFDEVTEKDIPTWNALISGYARCIQIESIPNILENMKEDGFDPNIYTWNGIISGHVENGHYESAMRLFSEMQTSNLRPDIYTVGIILPACSRLTTIERGKQVHAHAIRSGFESDVHIGAALVDMYAKCGNIKHALMACNRIDNPNLISQNAMLSAYAMYGDGEEGIGLFCRMLLDGFKPDSITFLLVLSSCVHAGSVERGREFFNLMGYYNMNPTLKHYTCMVDLLSRAGHLQEAYTIVKEMPMDPDNVIWGALLGGCVIHSNVGLGKIAAEKLIKLEPQNTGNYVMLANLYASVGRWSDVARTRQLIKEKEMQKNPGCSWIEDRNQIHAFVACDTSHQRTEEIYATLDHLTVHIRTAVRTNASSGRDLPSYFGRDDERAANYFIGDSDSVGASYDRYTRSNAQISLYGGGGSARPLSGGLSGHPIDDPRMIGIGGSNPVVTTKGHSMGLGGGRPLPPDASSTLFVEGLPANCTRRDASHIFRPFVGYKEVRLVTKEPRRSGDDPLVLCFVDFVSPAHAATAMDALQGYKFDEHDRDSVSLQLQFARYPGARSGGGHRGKR